MTDDKKNELARAIATIAVALAPAVAKVLAEQQKEPKEVA